MKYYHQSYSDLIYASEFSPEDKDFYRLFIDRCFDRIELGFIQEWSSLSDKEQIEDLQDTNRYMTNEKNKYLTIFESLKCPVFLLDTDNNILNLNHRQVSFFWICLFPEEFITEKKGTGKF